MSKQFPATVGALEILLLFSFSIFFFERGVLHMYAVNDMVDKWWCTIEADSESDVMLVLSEMPIIEWLNPVVHGLMFYNSADQMIPPISLN